MDRSCEHEWEIECLRGAMREAIRDLRCGEIEPALGVLLVCLDEEVK